MIQRFAIIIVLLFSQLNYSQMEFIGQVTVGTGTDNTIQPLSLQSNYSHSQTIYYPDQLKFRGYINEIRFFYVFSVATTPPTPAPSLILKIGQTDKEEFVFGDSFIPDTDLTTISVSTSTSGIEWRLHLETPYYYDGTQNLVISLEDTNPYASTSALDGFKGVENFNNPPTRSRISITDINEDNTQSTSVLYENSYAMTQFLGDLERCIWVSVSDIDNITSESADITLQQDSDVTDYRYVLAESGQNIPSTYDVTQDVNFQLINLQPAQDYTLYVKSDCNTFGDADYRGYAFKTRPETIQAPYLIDFEGDFNSDYDLESMPTVSISPEAGNNSENGVLFQGFDYPLYLNWNNSGDPFDSNTSFIKTLSLDIDLTSENLIHPVLNVDIRQANNSYFRIVVHPFAVDASQGMEDDFVYRPETTDQDQFRTISMDLMEYIGQMITIKLEHLSRSTTQTTYLDNVEIINSQCNFIEDISSISTTNGINVQWESQASNDYNIIIAPHGISPNNNLIVTDTNSYEFQELQIAKPYNIYIRNVCNDSNSPWIKYYASTNPNAIQVPFSSNLSAGNINNSEIFSVHHSSASNFSFPTGINRIALHQRISNIDWVGGDSTTESQAWDDNKDFITGLEFLIDATNLNDLYMELDFKMQHHYQSLPNHSWFRILVNGQQIGQSYNPLSKNSDPITSLELDLSSYVGNLITVTLQQSGRFLGEFNTGALSGDGVILYNLNLNGQTLSTSESNLEDNLSLYPNPVKTILNVNSTDFISEMEIYDINGRLLKTTIPSVNLSKHQINVEELSEGMYFINIQSGEASVIKKFIKQ